MARLVGILLAVSLGTAVGIGGYTFVYGEGASYLTNDPAACANCHVMREHLDGWYQSSHRAVAACNDCHAPHGLFKKYWTKARNGFAHSVAFTTGRFPQRLRITPFNAAVTEEACRSCHADLAAAVDGADGQEPRSCATCHTDVGHRAGAPWVASATTTLQEPSHE